MCYGPFNKTWKILLEVLSYLKKTAVKKSGQKYLCISIFGKLVLCCKRLNSLAQLQFFCS